MARTSYVDIPSEIEVAFAGSIKSGDRFRVPRLVQNKTIFSPGAKSSISTRSLLPTCSALWAGLSIPEREAWSDAAAVCNMRAWQLFVQDCSLRILSDIPGVAVPSLFYQAGVGLVRIAPPAHEAKIKQSHPESYFVARRVAGKKGMIEPVQLSEELVLPLSLSINYKADLTSTGAGSFARFYAIVKQLYQGETIDVPVTCELDLSCDWKTATASLSSILGQYSTYELFIHLYNVTGELFFDNVKAIHSGQNWVRDTFCDDVAAVFAVSYRLISQNWSPVTMPAGAIYDSVYIP